MERTSEQIDRELQALSIEHDQSFAREQREEVRRQEAEKQAEQRRREEQDRATKAWLATEEAKRKEEIRQGEQWWNNLRLNCFNPATGQFGDWGICQSFLRAYADSENQPCDWCYQCRCGWVNDYVANGQARQALRGTA